MALSDGEAQQLKIAAELKDSSATNGLYIMDEPTTGLHVEDKTSGDAAEAGG